MTVLRPRSINSRSSFSVIGSARRLLDQPLFQMPSVSRTALRPRASSSICPGVSITRGVRKMTISLRLLETEVERKNQPRSGMSPRRGIFDLLVMSELEARPPRTTVWPLWTATSEPILRVLTVGKFSPSMIWPEPRSCHSCSMVRTIYPFLLMRGVTLSLMPMSSFLMFFVELSEFE